MRKQSLSLGLVLAAAPALAGESTPSFTLDPVQVEATALPALKELDPVGPNNQPAWTASGTPRFTFSDVYTMAAGSKVVGVSAATDYGFYGRTRTEVAEYAAVGLKYGWQVGASFLQDNDEYKHDTEVGGKLEVKKTLAPWGQIWGNPTLSLSYAKREGTADTLRGAVLLGGNIKERWSWAANASYAHGFDTVRGDDFEVTGGAMYSVKDSKLAVGAEAVVQYERVYTTGFHADGVAAYVGPSVQWRPTLGGRTVNVNAAFLPIGVRSDESIARNRFAVGVSYGF